MTFRRSPLALAVLGLLAYKPLHPYGLQQLIRYWGKDEVVNVGQRATLYKTISRLKEAGLIAVHGTERDQQYPERTVYQLTPAGRRASLDWVREMLANPHREFPEFPAALAFLPLIEPAETLDLLERRRDRLARELARLESVIAAATDLPRVSSLEIEYLHAVTTAELRWVDGVIRDLRAGHIAWSDTELRAAAAEHPTPDEEAPRTRSAP